jgi:outer membrane protein assembly factor BamB
VRTRGSVIRRLLVLLAATLVATALAGAGVAGAAGPSWPTYHGTPDRNGDAGASPALLPASRVWSSPVLDGFVYGEPLVVGSRVYVVTENDTFYALDATTGQIVWASHVGTPVPLAQLPCGNIDPLGITGTPVVDTTTGVIYAIAEQRFPSVHHDLVGVDTATGRVVLRRAADPPGMIPVTQQQRAALAIRNGVVYWGFGGLAGDCGAYHGWVVGFDTHSGGALRSYRVPTTREGAVWGTSGVAIDGSGDLFVTTGNGESRVGEPYDHGNSLIRLDPLLHETGAWAPTLWAQWNEQDLDIASTGPLLLPNGDAFVVGKQQVGYLIGGSALTTPASVGDSLASARITLSGCAAYGGDAYDAATSTIYVPCGTGTRAVHADLAVTPPTLTAVAGWHAPAGTRGSPILAGGALWVVDYDGGTLYALDPSTGATRASFAIEHARHFTSVAANGGRVFVAADRTVHAFAPATTLRARPVPGYVLDAFGGLHPYGGAPALRTSAYWPGWDIARGIAVLRDNTGRPTGGYVLDGFGGIHPYGSARPVAGTGYWPGWDIARAIVTDPCDATGASGYVLDAFGGLHPYGGAPPVVTTGYWPGWKIARGVALDPCTGGSVRGEVVDGWGGLHVLAQRGHALPAAPRGSAFWPGSDLVRGIVTTVPGQGLVLDAYGWLHELGGAPNAYPSGYWPGVDIVRGVSVVAGRATGYVVDAFGGVHPYGGAPVVGITAYWPGWDIVRGVG